MYWWQCVGLLMVFIIVVAQGNFLWVPLTSKSQLKFDFS